MHDARTIEVLARQTVSQLSDGIQGLERLPAFRRRPFAFDDLSDQLLAVLLPLSLPSTAGDFLSRMEHARELGEARLKLASLRAGLLKAAARGWVEQESIDVLVERSDELSALLLILCANLRRELRYERGLPP